MAERDLQSKVALYRSADPVYPTDAPFHPGEEFPEYRLKGEGAVAAHNEVYKAVREAFILLGLDHESLGTDSWNPLGELISPGDSLVIKPNFVLHEHLSAGSLEALITHGSVIRAVLDYVLIALRGKGNVVVGDAPLQEGKWPEIVSNSKVDVVVDFCRDYSGVPVRLVDFRLESASEAFLGHVRSTKSHQRSSDRCVAVDLGRDSYLQEISDRWADFRVTNYNPGEMPKHHNAGTHEYLIAREVLDADVIINIPKLKTHRKAGMTCSLKNMVGINGSKDWLPHHTNGPQDDDGDQYQHRSVRKRMMSDLLDRMHRQKTFWRWHLFNLLRRAIWETGRHSPFRFEDPFFEGSWHGNDTIWRTVLDLNRIAFYADKEGRVQEGSAQRRYLSVVDAFVAGDGEGPLHPQSKRCGVIAAGGNPVAVDAASSLMMGFDFERIPTVWEAIKRETLGKTVWSLASNWWQDKDDLRGRHLDFEPTAGWRGQIEQKSDMDRSSGDTAQRAAAPAIGMGFGASRYDDG